MLRFTQPIPSTLTSCQEALNLNRELGELFGEAGSLNSLGYAYHHLGRYDKAITHYQQSIALFRELGHHYDEAQALTNLGDTHNATDNVAAARQAWQQALTIFEQLGHPKAEQVHAKLANLDTGPDEPTND